MIQKICGVCKKQFDVFPCRKDTAKYCSFNCKYQAQKNILIWNKGLTKETDERVRKNINNMAETKKRLFKEGKLNAWNKGLKGIHLNPKNEFKKGHIPHHKGKTKDNYEPLRIVSEKLKKNCPTKRPEVREKLKLKLDEKEIIRLYEKEEKSINKISKIFNCSNGVIKRILIENNIKIRGMGFYNKGKHLNPETEFKSGKDNLNFNNYSSFEPYDLRWTEKFKRLIRKRDNYVCTLCKIHQEKLNKSLEVHHIDYNKKLSFPQNCCSLCRKCHTLTNYNRKYWTKFFQSLLSERYGYKYSEDGQVIINLNNPIHLK